MKACFNNITICLLSLGISILFSDESISQWKIVNPTPFIDNLYVFYADSEECNVITERGMIISSTNNGSSWEYKYSNLPNNTNKFYFLSKSFGWATTEYINFRTTDGGQTWENMGNPLGFSNWDIFFDDSMKGWSVGNNFIKSTTDGGYSWNTYNVASNPQLNFISRYDDSTLFSGGSELFKSTDNGQSWNVIQTPTNFFSHGFVCGSNNNTSVGFLSGFISGDKEANAILKTTDAGVSWNYVFYDTSRPFISNIAINKDLVIAVDMKNVFRSTDFGESWDSTVIPIDDYLLPINIYFATDEIIYISGEFGNFLRSTDAGISFELLSHNNLYENINDFSLVIR